MTTKKKPRARQAGTKKASTATGRQRPVKQASAAAKPPATKARRALAKRPANMGTAKGPSWAKEGAKAPDFTAVAHDGSRVRLSALAGRPVVLYFYPKDDTPGCTLEACGFRDAQARLGRHRAVVLGVSPDSPQSHEKFRRKHGLPFTLLADQDHAIAERYGAWREKSLYGRKFLGVVRSTFVIDAAGRIAKAFTTVKPAGHEREVLDALAVLG